MLSMSPIQDLDRLKTAFGSLVKQAEPGILPSFMLWVDLKVSEFKVNGAFPPEQQADIDVNGPLNLGKREFNSPDDRWAGVNMVLKDLKEKCNRFNGETAEMRGRQTSRDNNNHKAELSDHADTARDLCLKKRHKKSRQSPEEPSPKSLKSMIDHIVKKETLSDMGPADFSRTQAQLPITIPIPPPPIASLAHYHSSLAKLLSQNNCLPPLPHHPPIMSHHIQMSSPYPHPPFGLEPVLPSEEAVCLKKDTSSVPPVAYEGSCFPRLTKIEPRPRTPSKDDICEKENLAMDPAPKSRVTSALRDLLTSKVSSQDEDSEPGKLVIDEEGLSDNPDYDGELPHSPMTDEDSAERTKVPSVCKVCGMSFLYRSSFRRHMKVHQGIFSHVCAICFRKFTRKEHFKRHKCSRKPNKASRGAHSDLSDQQSGATPKLEFPPTQFNESSMDFNQNCEENSMSDSVSDIPHDSPIKAPIKSCQSAESRRKSAAPRKVVMVDEKEPSNESFEEEANGEYHHSPNRPDESEMMTDSVASPQKQSYNAVDMSDKSYPEAQRLYGEFPEYSPRSESDARSYYSPQRPESYTSEYASYTYSPSRGDGRVPPASPYYSPARDYRAQDQFYSTEKDQQEPCDEALDLSRPQVSSSSLSPPAMAAESMAPVNLAGQNSTPLGSLGLPQQQEFTINTGSYKVMTGAGDMPEGGDRNGQFIKVVKQGNYLKLKEEAQVIAGQLCFVCPTCSKVFHRSSNFSRHMRIHRGVYSYVCPNCQRGFFRREHFQKHKCSRRGMSHTWDRKTKIDMVLAEKESSDADAGSDLAESEESYQLCNGDVMDERRAEHEDMAVVASDDTAQYQLCNRDALDTRRAEHEDMAVVATDDTAQYQLCNRDALDERRAEHEDMAVVGTDHVAQYEQTV